jgi:glutamyl-tRNA reductase
VEVRERVAIPGPHLGDALRALMARPGVLEGMILSTCNRTELYLAAEEWLDPRDLFLSLVRELTGCELEELRDQVYVFRGPEAVRHSFRVACSLDSLVVGEPQVLGQFKEAFREAENHGCVERELHRWIPRVFAVAKQVRSETGICDAAVSVSYAAVQLARKIFEDLAGKSIVLLGAGKMGELAVLHLREAGARSIVVASRTLARAQEVASRCSAVAVEFERREAAIAAADIVICSTGAAVFVLRRDELRRLLQERPERPLLVLDISMPRNVDPAAGDLPGVFLFNIDDLESAVEANRRDRRQAAAQAEQVVQAALSRFLSDSRRSQAAPAIAALRRQVHSICQAELSRLEQRMPGLSGQAHAELEVMLHRIAQKILHPAIMELKTIDCAAGREPSMARNLSGAFGDISAS